MSYPWQQYTQSGVIGSDAPDAFSLGRYWDAATGRVGRRIQFGGTEPIVVIGRNRSGKDACIGNYNALRVRNRSLFVLDPRGECAAITAPYRRMLGPTYIINPDGLHTGIYPDLNSDGRNPLAGMDWGPRFFEEAAAKAEAYIRIEGKDPHFERRARGNLLHPLIMWEVMQAAIEGRPPSLLNVRRLLTEADEFDPQTSRQVKGLALIARRMITEGGSQIASLIGSFAAGQTNDEMASARATADGQTQWMLSSLMQADMSTRGGVDFRELGDRPCTVYLVLPQYMLETHSQFMREALSSALRALYQPSNTLCTFWVNEFATLGRMEAIESALGMVAGCGIQLVFVVQSLTQLKTYYGDGWENFLGQAGAWALVGPPADQFTAQYLSDRSGQRTVRQPNVGMNLNTGGTMGVSSGAGYGQRPYLMPQDLNNIPVGSGFGFVWAAGLANPIPAYFPPYWDVAPLKARARRNPYYKG